MSNTHGIADFAHELQAVCADQLPACILSQTGLAVPVPPGLVLPAFATEGYVRETDTLVYVEQDAHTVTLTGADGTYWFALATDTWTAYAQWTTEPGTAYRWRPNATQPADVAGLLTFASVTVAGGAVTAVTPLTTVTRAAAGRALLGLGTMATQDANAVAISGGTATLTTLTTSGALTAGGLAQVPFLGVGLTPSTSQRIFLTHGGGGEAGIVTRAGAGGTTTPAVFTNSSGTAVGSISHTDSATSFNTSSDVRLKEAVQPLTDALDVLRAIQACSWRWKADGSPGEGFVASAVQPHVPLAVSGEVDAVDAQGRILPQAMDNSKLVPWLWASCQALLAQVDALTARLEALEARPG